MRVKYIGDGLLPLVGTSVVRKDTFVIVRNIDKLKRAIDMGYEFLIKEDGKEIPAEEYFSETEKVEVTSDIEVEEDVEEDKIQCEAVTSSGNQCKNEAKYPEDAPKYCGIHKSKLEE